jgi:hypothetical protein
MLLIYTPKITNRVKYTFGLIFRDILGVDYKLTADQVEFKGHTEAKFVYSSQPFSDDLFFSARNLLLETGITDQNIVVQDFRDCKIFFPVGKASTMPFDPFAASFYLVSRYEEYLPQIRDEYDRFNARESLAFQNGFLERPVVNIWANWIKELIKGKFPGFVFPEKKYQYVSTIDIDNAYAYYEKGVMRTVGGYIKSLFSFDFEQVSERTRVLLRKQKDPYDTYDFQLDIQKAYKLKPIYFFLLGDYGVNDKNLSIESKKFQSLIKMIGDYAEVGIHPSYGSNKDPEKLKKEINRLSGVLNREITKSRQHFLKLSFPETYRNLIDLDITDEYSMGFAQHIGFRAGVCNSFNFYDLDAETETKLRVHPFAVMDATLKYYMKVNPKEAINYVKPLIDEVKSVKGTFMSLWHNESLSDRREWYQWQGIYEEIVQLAVAST